MLGPFKTDDRGIYRIYGLEAGYYQVAAGGRSGQGFNPAGAGGYEGDASTYFPSSTIDTAAEVIVRAGDEATSIDIRYRDNRGHSLSGSIKGSKGSGQEGIQVYLTRASNGISEATTYVLPTATEKGFVFDALLDGEYFVTALSGSGALMEGIGAIVKRHGAAVTVTGFGTAFALHFTTRQTLTHYRDTLADDSERLRKFLFRALQQGLYLVPDGRFYTSAVHTGRELDETLSALDRVFALMDN